MTSVKVTYLVVRRDFWGVTANEETETLRMEDWMAEKLVDGTPPKELIEAVKNFLFGIEYFQGRKGVIKSIQKCEKVETEGRT